MIEPAVPPVQMQGGSADRCEAPARPSGRFLVLEPRIAFDAAAMATAQVAQTLVGPALPPDMSAAADQVAGTTGAGSGDPMESAQEAQKPGDSAAPLMPPAGQVVGARSIAFVDAAAGDYDVLLAAAASGIEVVMVGPTQDGLGVMRDTLADRSGLASIHVVGRMSEGAVSLGDRTVGLADMPAIATQLSASLFESGVLDLHAQPADGVGSLAVVARLTAGEISELATGGPGLPPEGTGGATRSTWDTAGAPVPETTLADGDPDAPRALAFIDAALPDAPALAAGMAPAVRTILLRQDADPWRQMTDALAAETGIGTVHLVSHGDGRALVIGGRVFDAGEIAARAELLQAWRAHLAPDADLLLYGCDLGVDGAESPLLRTLAEITGADVAASSDATAPASRGGNTALEVATGPIQSAAAALTGLSAPLAVTTVTDSGAGLPRITPEDTELAIGGISVADADNPAVVTIRVQTTAGTSRIGTLGGAVIGAGSDGSADLTLSGSLAQVNAAIATLRYTPALNQNSLTAGFAPQIVLTAVDVTNSGAPALLTVSGFAVTAVNDAPDLSTGVVRNLSEGGSVALTRAQLAVSDNALDPDILTGQQVIEQPMLQITSLPTRGTLSFGGGVVAVGTVLPVASIGDLRYTHTGGDVASATPLADSFGVTVSDGGGGATGGTVTLAIAPVNVAPSVSGAPSLIEGQVRPVAPSIELGDGADTLANSTIVIDDIVTGNQGIFFIDADGDNAVDEGEALSGTVILDEAQRTNLATRLKFLHDGAEPNAPSGVTAPSYRISVTDAGGGTGIPAGPVVATIVLSVAPNNDDPTLANSHATAATALGVAERATTTITGAMLRIADADRDPANLNSTTPAAQLVYTLETRPSQGELQLDVAGIWVRLGTGGRFTQADVDAGRLRYMQTTDVPDPNTVGDSFSFKVRDSAFGYDVWTDPGGATGPRQGGLRETPTGEIASQSFHIVITPVPNNVGIGPGGPPGPPTPGHGTQNPGELIYVFEATAGMLSSNSVAAGGWSEGNAGAADGGYVVTSAMLSYTIKRTDTRGTADAGDDVVVTVAPAETVYTLTTQAPHGKVQRQVGGVWQDVATYAQFTQADIDGGRIRFVHDGGEDHVASFGYRVSDGTQSFHENSFGVDVTPVNDRPRATGGSAQVNEGNGNAVRLTGAVVGMNDADGSLDGKTGEGAADFLWFRITGLAVDGGGTPRGQLQRWSGSAWVPLAAAPTDWLPATLLSASADGATSGLRYVHDGSEPLTYGAGPRATFTYVVRDDLADPGNAFATDTTNPADISGSAQSNQSAAATATIDILPVNTAPALADRPGDPEPTIGATIAGGGGLSGANEILAGVLEGSAATITNASLQAIDPDNTTTQRQFRVTVAPAHGVLQLNGQIIGVGSTFTQKDVDDGRISYRHSGAEVAALTVDDLGSYHDKFNFVVSDGVQQASFTGAGSSFLITLAPANQAPAVTGPTTVVVVDSAVAANNLVAGIVVSDPDLTGGVVPGEIDFVQVTLRLLNGSSDAPITDYATGFAGAGVRFGYASQSGGLWAVTRSGVDDILQFQGTRGQVNAALAGLTVTFAGDANATYKLQAIVDDRLRGATGALDASGIDANGGELNKGGGAVPATIHDWGTAAAVPAGDPNIAATTVTLRASSVNQDAIFTGPAAATVSEDTRTRIVGPFVVADPESAAFDTPVTVTISVPGGKVDMAGAGAQTSFTPAGGQAVTIGGDDTGAVVLTGRAADIQALLNQRNFADTAADANGGLFYVSASNANHDTNGAVAGDLVLTLSFSDAGSRFGGDVGGGSVANDPAGITVAVDITAVNDAPTVARTASAVAIVDTGATAVGGFSIGDVDDDNGYSAGETDGTLQVLVRLLDGDGTPLAAARYATLGIVLDTSAIGHGVTVDPGLDGAQKALEIRGTRVQINAYLAGLQVTFGALQAANIDTTYSVEVVADDRLRDAAGVLIGAANGGATNQGAGLPAVPATDTLEPYVTTVGGHGVFNVVSNTRSLFISTVNDPGSVSASAVTVNEGSAILVLNAGNANIGVADPDDNGAQTLSATVTVSTGTISAGGSGGSVSGAGTSTIVVTGTESDINGRLKNLTLAYPDPAGAATAADWNGVVTVTVVYRDAGSSGTRPGALTGDTGEPAANPGDYAYEDGTSNVLLTTRQFTATVNGVNDAPTRADATAVELTPVGEDASGGGAGLPGATVDSLFRSKFVDELDNVAGGSVANGFAGIAITTSNAIAAQGVWQYSSDGSTWTNLPPVSAGAALLLKAADSLRFVPAADFHGTPGTLVARLVDDSAGTPATGAIADVSDDVGKSGGSTRFSNSMNAVTLTTSVLPANDRPQATNTTLTVVAEDAADPAGATISSLGFGFSDATDNRSSIAGGGNAATGLGGIAIVGNAANAVTQGVWQFRQAGGAWVTIGSSGAAPSDAAALILPTDASLRFLPSVADYNGTPGGLSVRAADSVRIFSAASDISGSLAPGDTWSNAVTLGTSVVKLNDAPTASHEPANPAVTENASTGGPISIDPVDLLRPGTVADVDLGTTGGLSATVFGAGSITATLNDGISGDRLALAAASIVPAGVGVSGGDGGDPLVVTLAQGTTVAQVKHLLEAIQFRHVGDDPTRGGDRPTRSYTIVLDDGNNLQSGGDAGGPASLRAATIAGVVTITATNDPPQIDLDTADAATTDRRAVFHAGGGAVAFAAGTTNLGDPDSTRLDRLTLSWSAANFPDGPSERLVIAGATAGGTISGLGTLAAGGSVTLADGTVTDYAVSTSSGVVSLVFTGASGTELTIGQAESLIDALRYQNIAAQPSAGSARVFALTPRDGEGLDGNTATFGVTIVTVTSVTVNEASPYAVFTVSGGAGQSLSLAVAPGSATPGAGNDYTAAVEVSSDGGASWAAYGSGTVSLNAAGTLLVRVPILNDTTNELDETFSLTATTSAGASTGIATIVDDGNGTIFGADGGSDGGAVKDDDRPVSVSSVTVNEASPYAMFTVGGAAGQLVSLTLTAGTATAGAGNDFTASLDVSTDGGTSWVPYGTGTVALAGTGGTLLVRVPVLNDTTDEPSESFTLTARNTGGTGATGTATIVDDGNGTIFRADGGTDGGAVKDDDRPVSVNSVIVNEASPYAVFRVQGAVDQQVSLSLGSGTAIVGVDTDTRLQVLADGDWIDYAPGDLSRVQADGALLVRVALINDIIFERSETFTLTASNTGGRSAIGEATLLDDGKGDIFPDSETGQTDPAARRDDDTPPTLTPDPFRAETNALLGPYGERRETAPWSWTLIPLGPPPALITGVALATQQGNATGFATTPGPRQSSPDLGGAAALFDRPSLLQSAGEGTPMLPQRLWERPGDDAAGPAGLVVARAPVPATVIEAQETSVRLPPDIFHHGDPRAVLGLTWRMADGSRAPDWLEVDLEAGHVSVAPPPGFVGVLEIALVARDDRGGEAEATYAIAVHPREIVATPAAREAVSSLGRGFQSAGSDEIHDILALFADRSGRGGPATGAGADMPGRTGLGEMLALAALGRGGGAVLPADADRGN